MFLIFVDSMHWLLLRPVHRLKSIVENRLAFNEPISGLNGKDNFPILSMDHRLYGNGFFKNFFLPLSSGWLVEREGLDENELLLSFDLIHSIQCIQFMTTTTKKETENL